MAEIHAHFDSADLDLKRRLTKWVGEIEEQHQGPLTRILVLYKCHWTCKVGRWSAVHLEMLESILGAFRENRK